MNISVRDLRFIMTVTVIPMMVMMTAISMIMRMTVFMVEPLTGPRVVGKYQ